MKQTKQIKILVVTPLFWPLAGGSQQYMEDLYSTLVKNHTQLKIDVITYNTEKNKRVEKYRGLMIYRVPCIAILPTQFYLPNYIKLFSLLWKKREQYDLIHCNTRFFDSSWWGVIYAKLNNIPIIITDHCADHPAHEKRLVSIIAKLADSTIAGFFLKQFVKVYVVSQATKQFLEKKFKVKSMVIYGGVNISFFKRMGKLRRTNQVLFIGRMVGSKGARILLNVAKKFHNTKFIFVGPGPLVDSFRQEIISQNLTHIKVTGSFPQTKIARLMKQSTILVHPSYHNEGIPTVIKEAGLFSMAVIATDAGGTREIIEDGMTGLLVEQKDNISLEKSLKKLLKNPRLQQKLGKNLQKLINQKFNWGISSEIFYKEIISLAVKRHTPTVRS